MVRHGVDVGILRPRYNVGGHSIEFVLGESTGRQKFLVLALPKDIPQVGVVLEEEENREPIHLFRTLECQGKVFQFFMFRRRSTFLGTGGRCVFVYSRRCS